MQTGAHFFQDIFERSEQTNFRGRDKELSPLTSYTFRLKGTWEFIDPNRGWGMIKKASLSASYDYMQFQYDEFRDITMGGPPGEEPLYRMDAQVIQLFVSFWY